MGLALWEEDGSCTPWFHVACQVCLPPSFFACAASDVGEICPQDRPTWQQAIGRGSDGWPRAFQPPGSRNQKRRTLGPGSPGFIARGSLCVDTCLRLQNKSVRAWEFKDGPAVCAPRLLPVRRRTLVAKRYPQTVTTDLSSLEISVFP